MKFEEPTFRPPAKSGYFRVGSVSPKRSRNTTKPSTEKRRMSYKKGIDVHENRRRRSRISTNLGKHNKDRVINHLRSGAKKDTTLDNKGVDEKKCSGSAMEKLVAFYKEHNPLKLGDVDRVLAKYAGNEDELFANLSKRYNVSPAAFGVSASSTTTAASNTTEALFASSASANNSFRAATKDKLIAFYNNNNPSKLDGVEKLLAKYAGEEEQLFANLSKQYNVSPAVFGVGLSSTAPDTSNVTASFSSYASANNAFRALASPKTSSNIFGTFRQTGNESIRSRGRNTITSLNTYTDELRITSDHDSIMECD